MRLCWPWQYLFRPRASTNGISSLTVWNPVAISIYDCSWNASANTNRQILRISSLIANHSLRIGLVVAARQLGWWRMMACCIAGDPPPFTILAISSMDGLYRLRSLRDNRSVNRLWLMASESAIRAQIEEIMIIIDRIMHLNLSQDCGSGVQLFWLNALFSWWSWVYCY